MERNEPALVPEWLRSTGNINGTGSSGHHFHSDVSSRTQNRPIRSINDKNSTHCLLLDRSSSINSRRGLNSSSSKNPYSSFTRNYRDKNRGKEKERSSILELQDSNLSDPFRKFVSSNVEKNHLRRSQSLASRKPGELLPQRAEDKKNSVNNFQNSSNGVLLACNNLNGIQKAAFEKDFPTLGNEEKQVVRVTSPGLSYAVQSLPIPNSALLGGDKWTSALAEVPGIIGTNGVGNISSQQSGSATLSSGTSGANTSLNMAEALCQGPVRAHVTSQLPDKTHRLEELAMKQSRQLIPVTPTMPKALVSLSDKTKQLKSSVRASEMVGTAKNIQQHPFPPQTNNAPNMFHNGKFLVLRPVTTTPKDSTSLTANVANEQPSVSAVESKAANLTLNPRQEKKLPMSQAQSRSDFFNLMRKKTSPKAPLGAELPSSDLVGGQTKGASQAVEGIIYPDEEEAAFLRSLGWDENYGEDEGLTEEEINAFYQECMKLKPSLRICKGAQAAASMSDECKSGVGSARQTSASESD